MALGDWYLDSDAVVGAKCRPPRSSAVELLVGLRPKGSPWDSIAERPLVAYSPQASAEEYLPAVGFSPPPIGAWFEDSSSGVRPYPHAATNPSPEVLNDLVIAVLAAWYDDSTSPKRPLVRAVPNPSPEVLNGMPAAQGAPWNSQSPPAIVAYAPLSTSTEEFTSLGPPPPAPGLLVDDSWSQRPHLAKAPLPQAEEYLPAITQVIPLSTAGMPWDSSLLPVIFTTRPFYTDDVDTLPRIIPPPPPPPDGEPRGTSQTRATARGRARRKF